MADPLTLAEWRRRNAEIYNEVRLTPAAGRHIAWQHWRAARNDIFQNHPQSPFDKEQRSHFRGLSYFDYDPEWRSSGLIQPDFSGETFEVDLGDDGLIRFERVARIRFTVKDVKAELSLYWIRGYGGGLFLPFRDATNGQETYGGGRYLYDTIKGADLGAGAEVLPMDFNFSYNPSCAYHPRWVCPLPPPENQLPFAVTAGEMKYFIQD